MTDDPTAGPSDAAGAEERRLRALLGETSGRVPAGDALSAVYAVRRRVRVRRLLRASGAGVTVLGVTAAAVLISIGGHTSRPPGEVTAMPPYRLAGALVSFNGCTDYLSYLRRQAAPLVGPYGLRPPQALGYDAQLSSSLGAQKAAVPGGLTPTSGNAAAPHSGTTDQVAGVDEPDTVKSDGHLVLTLTGSTLRVLDTTARVLGSLQINGDTGGGLLLAGDRAVVLSSTSPPPSLSGTSFGPRSYAGPYPIAPQTGRAAVVDLSDPSSPRLVRTFQFDGAVVAARLVAGQIRLVLRSDGPRVSFQTPSSMADATAATAANRRLIATSTLDDWLPAWQVQEPDGSTSARHRLATCDAIARPQHASGISTVSVLSLDPQQSAPGAATSVVAAGDTVYATSDHLYVAGVTSDRASTPPSGPAPRPCCIPYQPGHVQTRLYDFATAGADRPRFLGAGSVPGSLINSYALDQGARGYLRVASTVQDANGASASRITVLAPSGQTLAPVGVVDGLGRGQQLRAVRFLGDEAYVVTFRSFDPLYVVDLRNPLKPVVAGHLEQPGFSEFLYPLPGHRLLGVGVEITNNEPSGLVVATYDVADPAHPRRLDASVLASGFPAANGGYDPHAFLYWAPTALAVLSLPDSGGGGGVTGAAAYRIGAGGDLTRLATIAHGNLTPTRTAVVGTSLWAFTAGGVVVTDLATAKSGTWHPY